MVWAGCINSWQQIERETRNSAAGEGNTEHLGPPGPPFTSADKPTDHITAHWWNLATSRVFLKSHFHRGVGGSASGGVYLLVLFWIFGLGQPRSVLLYRGTYRIQFPFCFLNFEAGHHAPKIQTVKRASHPLLILIVGALGEQVALGGTKPIVLCSEAYVAGWLVCGSS